MIAIWQHDQAHGTFQINHGAPIQTRDIAS